MAIGPGTRIGPYELASLIGEGGMGQVYCATDTNLKRTVAVKVLPEAVASDAERLARFQREAEVLARLNHPNIAQIYGLEKNDSTTALVMELVEGDDLAQRIARGPIPLNDALPIAKQIAQALEAAREQGVIHRDLKPANIKLRTDGTVKVLDFGLAKLVPLSDSGPQASDLSPSPTIAIPPTTRMGVIMGTVAYMSPEQTRGMAVDRRTDIWSFGCVLYEMLSGQPAFAGQTITDTIARVLEREPDWHALPPSMPPQITELLRRCLQKDQQQRPQDIVDVGLEIDKIAAAPLQSRGNLGLRLMAGGGVLAVTLLIGAGWYQWRESPPIRHLPVSVLIADLDNQTNDPLFDRTLEPMLRILLEAADFITAYDRNGIRSTFGVSPPERLDASAAREIAVKQGVGIVLAGTIASRGVGFDMSIKALQAVSGNEITEVTGRADSRDGMLGVATRLVNTVRTALGDQMSESDQLRAVKSVANRSLEAVSHFAAASKSQSEGRYQDARGSLLKALELDPTFASVYQGLAVVARNQGRLEEAHSYIEQGLRHLDEMTQREQFSTRGFYYRLTGDYEQCVREYGEMTAQFTVDPVAHNQRALCASKLRNLRLAVDEMREALLIVPNHTIFRGNLAVYTAYSGDFGTAEREARSVQRPSDLASIAIAFAQLGQGLLSDATDTYRRLAAMGARGASWSASGLADLALYEGRLSEARRLFEQGAATDLASNNQDRAARKLASLAYVHLLQERPSEAVDAAQKALAISNSGEVRLLAASTLVEASALDKAQTIRSTLLPELADEPQAYAKVIEGKIALRNGDSRQAIRILIEANKLLDTWLGHFELGRAYLEAGAFAQADSEFGRCIRRSGEALSLFLDEEPTYGYFPRVYYYQGRVREGLKNEGFAESYRAYLRIREKAGEDPLLAEVRRRAGL